MKFDIYRVPDRQSDRDPTRTAPPRRELPPNGNTRDAPEYDAAPSSRVCL